VKALLKQVQMEVSRRSQDGWQLTRPVTCCLPGADLACTNFDTFGTVCCSRSLFNKMLRLFSRDWAQLVFCALQDFLQELRALSGVARDNAVRALAPFYRFVFHREVGLTCG
jgi:hypothetical protein